MSTSERLTKARFVLIASFGLLIAVFITSSTGNGVSASPFGGSTTITPTSTITTTSIPTPGCGPAWVEIPGASTPASSTLNGVAAISSNDVWAVGYSYGNALALIEHWDGTAWSVVSPDVGTYGSVLQGVAAVGHNDVWAVGFANGALIEHWNGSTWNVVPNPSVGGNLNGVAAISSNDVWAVGHAPNSTTGRTLIEHWNGSTWSIVSSPNVGTYDNELNAVTARTGHDIWAVGFYADGSTVYHTLIEHWNGSTWSIVSSPSAGDLFAIAAVSGTDVWAVGDDRGGGQTLIEHWNGSAWSVVTSPVAPLFNKFTGVTAISSTDVWAVGIYYYFYHGGTEVHTLTEHWNGSAWSIVPSPSTSGQDDLNGVAAISSADVWAVGYQDNQDNSTLIEHYSPVTCSPTPTPTIQPPPCPGERFTDVCPGDFFYTSTLALANDNILSGYDTVPPCNNSLWIPCFKPYNSSTRGQISKVVSLAANFNDPVTTQTFEDVPPGSTFYTYTERMAERNIITGYPCGGPNEPCVPPNNRPYFRTNNNVTRGQLSKMTSLAFNFNDPPIGQTFEDVPPGSAFYTYTIQLYNGGIITGYPCGGPDEPCNPPGNLPYFRPNNNVTRGQTAKIVQLARTQPAVTPTITPTTPTTPTLTSPTATSTLVATLTPPLPTRTPTCCNFTVSNGASSCTTYDTYPYTFDVNNDCLVQLDGTVTAYFEASVGPSGPWNVLDQSPTLTMHFPPGTSQVGGNFVEHSVPPQYSYYRVRAGLSWETCNGGRYTEGSTATSPLCRNPSGTPTSTPTSPTSTPACCSGVTGAITSSCQGSSYAYTYTLTNTCPLTVTANGCLCFEVAPQPTGPWTSPIHADFLNSTIPSGVHQYSGTLWSGPLPAGNNWWRIRLYLVPAYSGACWSIDEVSTPQPACVLGTATPSATGVPTATALRH